MHGNIKRDSQLALSSNTLIHLRWEKREDIELSVETGYLYKKKTGFPVWTDNGKASATAKKIRLVLTVSSFHDKPIVVEKTQCTIGSLKIRFHESQHRQVGCNHYNFIEI